MPDGRDIMQGVIPYLAIDGARRAIEFYAKAFGAQVWGDTPNMPGTDKLANATLIINGGALMLSDHFPEMGQPPAKAGHGFTMQLVVTDGDSWWTRAVEAGCTVKTPFEKQFWGDRYGQVLDPFGIEWAFNEPSAESQAKAAEIGRGGVADLSITRTLDAPRAAVWRCWTEPDLLKQWFCPKPWYVSEVKQDIRPGGGSFIVMNGPNGEKNELPGQFLDVIDGKKLVFTDAFVGDWRPGAGAPFMVGYVELEDAPGGKTRMVWGARHWSEETRQQHLAMGFEQGWNAAADQLNDLARSL